MKRIFSFLIVCVFAFGLVACNNNSTTGATTARTTKESTTTKVQGTTDIFQEHRKKQEENDVVAINIFKKYSDFKVSDSKEKTLDELNEIAIEMADLLINKDLDFESEVKPLLLFVAARFDNIENFINKERFEQKYKSQIEKDRKFKEELEFAYDPYAMP